MRTRHKQFFGTVIILFALFALSAIALLNGNTAVSTPVSNSLQADNVYINVTFPDLADVTIFFNLTDTGVNGILNTSFAQSTSVNYTWPTNNGSFPDGHYNITVFIANASNSTDNETLFITNVTVDNTGPTAVNLGVSPNVTYVIVYTNSSPTFSATITDTAGVARCSYARFENDLFTQGTITGNASPYPQSALCAVTLSGQTDGTVFNFTFRGTDQLGNVGANSTRVVVTVDDNKPQLVVNTPNASRYRDGMNVVIDVNITDAGVNITNGTICSVLIDGSSSSFSGTVRYVNTTGKCLGNITLGSSSGLSDGVHIVSLAINDSLNSTNSTQFSVIIDNTAPQMYYGLVNPYVVEDGYTEVNFLFNISDTGNVSVVWITYPNGTFLLRIPLVLGNVTNGSYTVSANMSDFGFGCVNERVCDLLVYVNDTLNNTDVFWNTSAAPNLLLLDSYAPKMTLNGTNVSSALAGETALLYARWTDVIFLRPELSISSYLYRFIGGSFVQINTTLDTRPGNWTNFTFSPSSADEGQTLVFRIGLEDWLGHLNVTANLTINITNQTPSVTSIANDTIFAQNSTLRFTALDLGSGFNASYLSINISAITAGTNTTITSSANASLFNCSCPTCGITNGTSGSGNAATLSNWTCLLQYSWPLGNISLLFTVRDAVGNTNQSSYQYFVTNVVPDIVNVSINGQVVANTTTSLLTVRVDNESPELTFNWSMTAQFPVTSTTIAFLNLSSNLAYTALSVPATHAYNVTAGKNYLVINGSAGSSLLSDAVQMDLTANVPLNITSIAAQYARSPVDNVIVVKNGVDITSQETYVNGTIDFILNISNSSVSTPYSATVNYTGLDGLALRWNATPNAFTIASGSVAEMASRSGQTNTNVTLFFKSNAGNAFFFDQQEYIVVVGLNFTVVETNLTPYYVRHNSTVNTIKLLQQCGAVPTGFVNDSSACYVGDENSTWLYLPRFDDSDEIFIGNATSDPAVLFSISTPATQSVVPFSLAVTTPAPPSNPATAFCVYNLSLLNVTNGVVSSSRTVVPFSNFTFNGLSWLLNVNLTGIADGNYNLSVNCTDRFGRSNITKQLFSVADVTPPRYYNVSVGNVGYTSAVVSASTDEYAVFSIKYGTIPRTLDGSASGTSTAINLLTADSISLVGLSINTGYYYNITACDAKNQCNTTGPTYFVTNNVVGGGGGGGGGGGAAGAASTRETIVGRVETSDVRSWSSVAVGQTITYETRNDLSFTEIMLHFSSFAETVRIVIRQFKEKPESLPPLGTAYEFLHIENSGVQDNADQRVVTFAVNKDWLAEHNLNKDEIALYRLENAAWVMYVPAIASENALSVMYNVSLPGFSYFAIAKKGAVAPTSIPVVVPQAVNNVTSAPPLDMTNSSTNTTKSGGDFVVASAKGGKNIPSFVWILIAVIITVILVVVGLQQYKAYQENSASRQAQMRSEYVQEQRRKDFKDLEKQAEAQASQPRTDEHDPMSPAHHYIEHMRGRGVTDDDIRKKLVGVGWDPIIVDMELLKDTTKAPEAKNPAKDTVKK